MGMQMLATVSQNIHFMSYQRTPVVLLTTAEKHDDNSSNVNISEM
jgi:hypothetical protein